MKTEEIIKKEEIKIRTDKNLSDKQKRERLQALEDLKKDMKEELEER